jgi:hypothetical protein
MHAPDPGLARGRGHSGGIEMMGPVPADAQCSVLGRRSCAPKFRTRYVDSRIAE